METLGNIVDKLIICNLKLWKVEDIKRDPEASDKVLADATKKSNLLNQQRNCLIQEFDEKN